MDQFGVGRREALRRLATGAAGAAATAMWVDSLSALSRAQAHAHAADAVIGAQEWKPQVFSARQDELVTALAEMIIPQTDTPGAKAARVNRFIDTVLHEAPARDREAFLRGLSWLDNRSRTLYGRDFLAAGTANQTALLTRLSAGETPSPEDRTGVEFFRAIKGMTIDGYYTSEIGLRQELGDDGQLFHLKFEGCTHPEHQG